MKQKLKSIEWTKPQNIFLILALLIGTAMAVINPAFQECDGPSHFYRAMDVSYGNLLGSFINLTHEDGVIYVPENVNDIAYRLLEPNEGEGGEYMQYLKSQKFSENKMKMTYYDSVTSVVYWPQGLGIWLGRTLNVSMYGVILLGRLFNLLAYVFLTYWALRLMPFYKNLLAMLALMPITLYQASSLSQDSVLNGLGFLFLALCCYYAFDEKVKLTWKHVLPLGFILLAMFLSKYVYACMGLLVFLIPKEKFESKKAYWRAFVISLIPLVVLGGYVMSRVSSGIENLQAVSVDGGMTQVEYLKMYPLSGIKVLLSTVLVFLNEYLSQLNVLGSLNYPLSMLTIILPCFVTVIACLESESAKDKLKIRHRVLMLVTFGITFFAILMGLYIGDGIANPVGASVVAGVQGRYFIILLALPFMALGSRKIKNEIAYFTVKIYAIMALMLLYAVFVLIKTCY